MTTVPGLNPAEHCEGQLIPAGSLVTVPLPVPAVETSSVCCCDEEDVNVAVTERSASIVSTQVAVPAHAPDHPSNVEPGDGDAERVTTVPAPYCVEQVVPQSIPAGLLTTIPSPSPAFVTVSVLGGVMNVAVTDLSASIVSTQGAVPEQSCDQPVNTSPAAGEAVSVTCVESSNVAEQVEVQTLPPGWIVTEPVPPPVRTTVKVRSRTKVAVTDRSEFIVSAHEPGPVPEQAGSPDQPTNRLPGDGSADRVTTVPWSKPAEHVVPQSIPAGLLVTVPAPLPAFVTLRTGTSVNVAVRKWF